METHWKKRKNILTKHKNKNKPTSKQTKNEKNHHQNCENIKSYEKKYNWTMGTHFSPKKMSCPGIGKIL